MPTRYNLTMSKPSKDELTAELILAIQQNKIENVKKCIAMGVNVNAPSKIEGYSLLRGMTALHVSSCHGRYEISKLLVKEGADVNHCGGPDMSTPLMEAVYSQEPRIIKLLLNAGASPDVQNNAGDTALMQTTRGSENKMINIARILIDRRAKLDIQNIMGRTALHEAIATNKVNIARILMKAGANPLIQDSQGKLVKAYADNKLLKTELKNYTNEWLFKKKSSKLKKAINKVNDTSIDSDVELT